MKNNEIINHLQRIVWAGVENEFDKIIKLCPVNLYNTPYYALYRELNETLNIELDSEILNNFNDISDSLNPIDLV